MKLWKKLAKRIDNDNGFDNELLAKDLEKIAQKHFNTGFEGLYRRSSK